MADVSVEFGAKDTGLEATLNKIQAELATMKTAVASGELSMEELERTMKRIGQVEGMEKRIKAIGEEASGAAPKTDKLGKDLTDMGEKGETAGKKVEFSLKNVGLAAGVAAAAAKATTAVIDAAFAGVQKTIQSFGDALNMGGRLSDLSERTGVATDKLLEMERAMNNAGVGADNLGPLINKMQKALVDAADGSSGAADALTQLGIPLSSLQSLSPDEQFQRIGKAIAGVEDPAKRAALSMEIFGKSGGALNQLFSNLDGELANARAELGTMPSIMKELGSRFDGVSDKIAVIQGKFIEFASGILSKTIPAIEAIATGLSLIDAAKLGQQLADAFVGAGSAMKGFEAAMSALKTGNLSQAFEIAFQAIKVQLMETGNSIFAILSSAFKAAGDFVRTIFDPSSMTMTYISKAFELLGLKVGGTLASSIASALPDDMIFGGLKKGMTEFAERAKSDSEALFGAMYHDVGFLKDELAAAGASLPESFDKHMRQSEPLLNTQDEVEKLNSLIAQTEQNTQAVTQAQSEAEAEAKRYFKEYMTGVAAQEQANNKLTEEAKAKAQVEAQSLNLLRQQAMVDLQIAEAKAAGNVEEADRLEKQKLYNKYLEEARTKLQLNENEAQKYAARMTEAAMPAKTIRNILDEIAQKKIDEPVKSLKERTDEARGKLVEMKDLIGVDMARMSLPDILKNLGIDTFSLTDSKSQLEAVEAVVKKLEEAKPSDITPEVDGARVNERLDAVRDYLKQLESQPTKLPIEPKNDTINVQVDGNISPAESAIRNLGSTGVDITLNADASIQQIRKNLSEEIDTALSSSEGTSILKAIQSAVDSIKTLVAQIEPKLPTNALTI